MTSASSHVVFDDMFTIADIDKEGRKFDRGKRMTCNLIKKAHAQHTHTHNNNNKNNNNKITTNHDNNNRSRCFVDIHGVVSAVCVKTVSRLHAHSKNYDMDLTLDYNVELFPLKPGQAFALSLATSLARGGGGPKAEGGLDVEDKDQHVWRPDGKGQKGIEEDYDYVMYGKVCMCAFFFLRG
jgi:RNA polymerase Rpb8